jgi:hypothetical protein
MVGGVKKPGRTRGFGLGRMRGAQLVALRVWFGLSNILRKPKPRSAIADASVRGVLQNPAVAAFAGAMVGCLTTLYLSAFGIAPGIASALATSLICGQVLILRATHPLPTDFFTAVYGGSFGGMTPVLLLSEGGSIHPLMLASALFLALSVVSGVVFGIVAEIDARMGRRLASGYGGRSGAVATLASFLFVALAPTFGADGTLFRGLPGESLELDLRSAVLAFTACAVGLYATMTLLRWRSVAIASQADRTFLASAVALIGMAALHLSCPNDARLLDAFYAGCFLGMSTPERLGGWLQPLLGALVLTVMLALVRLLLPGLGGDLGLAAFVTAIVVVALTTFRVIPDAAGQGSSKARMPRRATGTIAYPLAGVLALGCFVMLLVSAPQLPAPDRAVLAATSMPAAPQPVALAIGHEASDAPSLETPSANPGNVDLGISLELPRDIKMQEHALGESTEPPSSTAASSTREAAGAAEAPAESQPALLQSADGPRAASDGAVSVTAEPGRLGGLVDDTADAEERQLFHEFMQWRAARGGTAQIQPQPVRTRSRPAPVGGLVTPVAAQAHPARPRPSSSIDPTAWPASLRSIHPPRAVGHNATGNPAPNAAP